MNIEELQILLAVNTAISRVRGKRELLTVVIEKLKPIFGFQDCGLFVVGPDQSHWEDLTGSDPSITSSEADQSLFPLNENSFRHQGSLVEPLLEHLRHGNGPLIWNNSQNNVSGWENYVRATVPELVGYQESMVTLLQTGGKEVGLLFLNSVRGNWFQITQFPLFQAIANQIAVAMANSLANEEIIQRRQETTVLLAISNAIASVQNRTDLFRVICEQIQPVLPFDDAGIAILNETGDLYCEFLTSTALPSAVNQQFTTLGYDTGWLPVDAPIQKGFDAKVPLLILVADEANQNPDTFYLPVFEQAGIQQLIVRSLQMRGKTIGEINFNSRGASTNIRPPIFRCSMASPIWWAWP